MKELFRLEYLVATFFGAGYFPKFPGTFASLVAILPLFLVPFEYRFLLILCAVLLVFAVSLPLISKVEKEKGNDSSIIVIDEVLGVWLIFCSPIIPFTWFYILTGLILFRLFDILKPWFIGTINNKVGAVYVILDDIVAALFSSIILHFFIFISKFIIFFKFIS